MAIVGTAFVRLRVIGDKLKSDLTQAVHDAVDSNPAIEKSGEDVGEKISTGVKKHMSGGTNGFDRVADDIGNAIGRGMGDAMGRSLRNRLSTGLKDTFNRLKPVVSKAGTDLSGAFKTFKDGIEKQSKKINLGSLMTSVMAFAVTALPSLLSGAGAVIGAYAATAITALSTIGPAVAGGAIAGIAALSALKITAGLVGLAMKTVTPQLEDFQKRSENFKKTIATPVQAGLLGGLNASMRVLGPVVSALNSQLVGTGVAVGGVALGFADMLAKGENVSRLGTILTNNNTFIAAAGAGVTGFGQALVILLAHLGPVLDYLGSGLQQLGEWAANAMSAAEASGSLDSFISRMFGSLTYFVGILVDFGVGVANVFKAASGASGGMLTNLHDMAQSFRDWTGDPANQERMTAFFEKMRTIVAQVDGILGKLVGGSLKALEGTNVDSLSRGLDTLSSLGPPIAQMFNAIKDAAGDNLQKSLQNFADIITQLANSGVIGILSSAFSNLLAIISQVLALPGVGPILSFVAGLAVLLKTVGLVVNVLKLLGPAFKLIWTVGGILIDIIGALVATFGAIPLIIAAVVAGLIYFFGFTETGRKIVKAAFDGIMTAVKATWDFLVMAFNAIVAAFQAAIGWIVGIAQTVGGALAGAWSAVVSGVSTAWNAVVNAVQMALTTVWNIITGVFNAVWGFISPILSSILGIFTSVFTAIWNVVSTILNALLAFWTAIFIILLIPVRVFEGVVILIWQGIVALIGWAMDMISSVVSTVWNAVWGFISGILTAIGTFISDAWTGYLAYVTNALNNIWNVVTSIWNSVWGFISGVLGAIGGFISDTWNSIYGTIAGFLFSIYATVMAKFYEVRALIQGVMDVVKDKISSAWSSITDSIRGAMSTAKDTITSVWNDITGFLRKAMDTISGIVGGIWDSLKGAGSDVVGGLKSAVNSVIGVVNGAIGGINSIINTANKLPGVDIPTISTIPRLAKGGVVSPSAGGTLALVAEAGRKERVEPLDSDGLSKRDRAILNQFSLAAGSGGANVSVYLGTRELMELVDVVVEEREGALAGAVSTGRKG